MLLYYVLSRSTVQLASFFHCGFEGHGPEVVMWLQSNRIVVERNAWQRVSGGKRPAERRWTSLACLQAKSIKDGENEYLAVAGVARMSGRVNGLQYRVHFLIVTNNFEAHLSGQFQAWVSAMFGMGRIVFLAEAAGVGNGHSVNLLADQGIFYPVQRVWWDKGEEILHD
jgi:hypothetical protein